MRLAQPVILASLLLALCTLVSLKVSGANCMKCHDDHETQLQFNHRSQGLTCTACHGESLAHQDKPRNSPDVAFNHDTQAQTASAVCLNCHDDSTRRNWTMSEHGTADIGCNNCHSLHKTDISTDTEANVCGTCHKDQLVKFNYPTTHPLNNHKLSCSNCHTPHGDNGTASPTDRCTRCHQEKRGPFLFEHDPVTEDCGICHEPHGSTLPSLLTSRPPFLCQSCHMTTSHPSRLATAQGLTAGDTNLAGKSCINCHSQVHGSNHPSGARLTR